MSFISNTLDAFWKHIDDGQVVRRIAFFAMMWLTYTSYKWVMAYVETIDTVGIEHAAIIGAVLGPISGLQAAIIKFYAENPHHFTHRNIRVEPKTTVILPRESYNEEEWRK